MLKELGRIVIQARILLFQSTIVGPPSNRISEIYVQVIFEGSHPTLILTNQKMSEIIQVNVPNLFYFDEIPKMIKLGPKNRFWDLKIKINPSGIRPNLNLSFFEIQT